MNIYSFGNSELLWQLLNGLAIVFNDGSMNKIMTVAVIGFLLVSMIGALMKAGGMYQQSTGGLNAGPWIIIAPMIIGLIMITPKASVTVSSAYDPGNVRSVDNVPLVLAFPFSISSQVGMYLTEIVENVFTGTSGVSMIEYGYITPIKVMKNAATVPTDGPVTPLKTSISNYISDCLQLELDSVNPPPELTLDQIMDSPDPWSLMGIGAFTNWDTTISAGQDGKALDVEQQVSCATAYATLNLAVNDSNFGSASTDFSRYMAEFLKPKPRDAFPEGAGDTIAEALSLLNLNLIDSQKFAKNQVIKRAFEQSAAASAVSEGNAAWAVMIEEARQKEFLKNVAGQQIFMDYVVPLISFLEMLVVIMTILVPIMVAVGKYDFLAGWIISMLWVAMWPATMAICNVYVVYGMEDQVAGLVTRGAGVGYVETYYQSMRGSVQILAIASEWIDVGYKMAAAVPIITAALLGGSLMSLGGMMSGTSAGGKVGGDVNAQTLLPQAIAPKAGYLQQGPDFTSGASGIATRNDGGLAALGSTLNAGTSAQKALSAQQQLQTQASQKYDAALSKIASSDKTALSNAVNSAVNSNTNQDQIAAANSAARTTNEQFQQSGRLGVGQQFKNASDAIRTASGGLAAGLNVLGVQGNLVNNLQEKAGFSKDQATSLANDAIKSLTGGLEGKKGVTISNTGTSSNQASKTFNDSLSSSLGQKEGAEFKATASQVETASSSVGKLQQLASTAGSTISGTTGQGVANVISARNGTPEQQQQANNTIGAVNNAALKAKNEGLKTKEGTAEVTQAMQAAEARSNQFQGDSASRELFKNAEFLNILSNSSNGALAALGNEGLTAFASGALGITQTPGATGNGPAAGMQQFSQEKFDSINGAGEAAKNQTQEQTANAGQVLQQAGAVAGRADTNIGTPTGQGTPTRQEGAAIQAKANQGGANARAGVANPQVAMDKATSGPPPSINGGGQPLLDEGKAARFQEQNGATPQQAGVLAKGNQGGDITNVASSLGVDKPNLNSGKLASEMAGRVIDGQLQASAESTALLGSALSKVGTDQKLTEAELGASKVAGVVAGAVVGNVAAKAADVLVGGKLRAITNAIPSGGGGGGGGTPPAANPMPSSAGPSGSAGSNFPNSGQARRPAGSTNSSSNDVIDVPNGVSNNTRQNLGLPGG